MGPNECLTVLFFTVPQLGESLDSESFYDHTECPRCHSVISLKYRNKNKDNENNDENKCHSASCKSRRGLSSREQALPNKQLDDAASLVSQSESRFDTHKHLTPIPERVAPKKYMKKGKLYRSVDDGVDWSDLNEKIGDWFEAAKTPGR